MENVFPSLGFLVDILLVCEMPTVRTQEKNLLYKATQTHVAYPLQSYPQLLGGDPEVTKPQNPKFKQQKIQDVESNSKNPDFNIEVLVLQIRWSRGI